MTPPDEWVLNQFDARLAKAMNALGPLNTADAHAQMFLTTIKRVVVKSMQDGLIGYCPFWCISFAHGQPNIEFNWDISLTEDWRDIALPTLH